jgi:hypothetical protein
MTPQGTHMQHRRTTYHAAGAGLLLVVSIAGILLAVCAAFVLRQRADVEGADKIRKRAQARIVLSSALLFLQESSRLGWSNIPGQEACGWDDVRALSTNPAEHIGPRGLLGDAPALGGLSTGVGPWPSTGGAMRGDMFQWNRTPYAVRPGPPNPLSFSGPWDRDTSALGAEVPQGLSDWWAALDGKKNKDYQNTYIYGSGTNLKSAWSNVHDTLTRTGAMLLDPQPVSDTWSNFSAGDKAAVASSVGLGWFRVYRETASEHDGGGGSTPSPWYDTMPIDGDAVFIVTVGCGPTRGYRFFDRAGHDGMGGSTSSTGVYIDRIEPVTAQESGLYGTLEEFASARAQEEIQWYRVRWSAAVGGATNAGDLMTVGKEDSPLGGVHQMVWAQQLLQSGTPTSRSFRPAHAGSFTFVQSLDREPPTW